LADGRSCLAGGEIERLPSRDPRVYTPRCGPHGVESPRRRCAKGAHRVARLWVLSLPRTPFFASPEGPLRARGAVPLGAEQRFGALSLQAWDLRAPPLAADLTRSLEEHEVDYVARRCVRIPIGGRLEARGAAGTSLHVRAGVIGERAYDANRPPVVVQIFADGAPAGCGT